jgi:hypothetical protein
LEQVKPLVIDYYLGWNPDLQSIGRLLIAWVILECEHRSQNTINNINRDTTAPDDWCRFIIHQIAIHCRESKNLLLNKVSFVTFNYDESEKVVGLPLSVHPMHRKKESVGERALKRVHAELNLRLMHVRKLLAAVETHAALPLPWIDIDDGGGPRQIARTIRTAWMIPPGPIQNMTEYVEKAGILVIWCDFGAAIDGVTMRLPDLPPCVFLNRTAPADRMRFSLAQAMPRHRASSAY